MIDFKVQRIMGTAMSYDAHNPEKIVDGFHIWEGPSMAFIEGMRGDQTLGDTGIGMAPEYLDEICYQWLIARCGLTDALHFLGHRTLRGRPIYEKGS